MSGSHPKRSNCESVDARAVERCTGSPGVASSYAGVDQLVIDVTCMRLSARIEVLARLVPDTRSRLFGDNWQFMWGMRNRIAHGYLLVDSGIVHQTIEIDLPDIVRVITRELSGV